MALICIRVCPENSLRAQLQVGRPALAAGNKEQDLVLRELGASVTHPVSHAKPARGKAPLSFGPVLPHNSGVRAGPCSLCPPTASGGWRPGLPYAPRALYGSSRALRALCGGQCCQMQWSALC